MSETVTDPGGETARPNVLGRGVLGMVTGLAATYVMNQAAGALVRSRHPDFERHFHYLTFLKWVLGRLGQGDRFDENQLWTMARALHYAYGGAMSGAYFVAARRSWRRHPVVRGGAYGAVLWAAAFCGFIPALKVYRPAWRFERAELEVTLLAHLVYGSVVGAGHGATTRTG